MKKVLTLVFISISFVGLAQYLPLTWQVPDSLLSKNPLQFIDSSSTRQTNMLLDRVNLITAWNQFQGFNDSPGIGGRKTGRSLLQLLDKALDDSTLISEFDSLVNREQALYSQFDATPIYLNYFEYDKVKQTAYDDSTLLLDPSGNFTVNPSSNTNFLEKKRFFAVGSGNNLNNLAYADSLPFVFPSSLVFSNLDDSIISLEVDFGDDLGFRTINFDQVVKVLYSAAEDTLLWSIKMNTQNSGMLYTKMQVVTALGCGDMPFPVTGPWGSSLVNGKSYQYQLPPQHVTAWNGIKGLGNAYVWYRPDIAPGEENHFRKPLIIVEGIDFGKDLPGDGRSKTQSIHIGAAGWPTLWNCQPDDYPFENFPNFLTDLHDEGYDIIMLDFMDGADYMQRNGLLLAGLIEQINYYKLGEEQNVVIGASMGGQVARYALTHMEKYGPSHCTRLFASFDSPWKGAHVPLGIQWFLKRVSS
jgi:hypothetical protein